ncbi:MAG: DinB family protein [Pyrinomonadaceae bacterium]
MNKTYRKGAVGAMMDEYERAAAEFRALIGGLSEEQYSRVVDAETADENCRSVRTVMSHVVAAGYGYADYIRDAFSMTRASPQKRQLAHGESLAEFDAMMAYTETTLADKWELSEDEITAVSMTVHWGPTYDLEQLLEHAIVHILRHRRQIEKWGLANEHEIGK